MQGLRTDISVLDSTSKLVVSWETGGNLMRYWVLESAAGNYAQVHRAECERCQDGQKPQQGSWAGFDDYTQAMEHAAATERPVLQCTLCHPERYA